MKTLLHPKVEPDSLRAIAQEVLNVLYAGSISFEADIPIRQIENHVLDLWSSIQKLEDDLLERKMKTPNPDRLVTYKCLDLEDTDDFFCKCSTANWSLKKLTLPKMMEYRMKPYITFVGVLDSEGITQFIKANSVQEVSSLSSALKKPIYLTIGAGVYVALPPEYSGLCEVTVIGIPKDPLSSGTLCFDPWAALPNIDKHFKILIKDKCIEFFSTMVRLKENKDILNNANDSNVVTGNQTGK
jgi:hypothetical protein